MKRIILIMALAASSAFAEHVYPHNPDPEHLAFFGQLGRDSIVVTNPPVVNVKSVNGKVGDVVLQSADVGAVPASGGNFTGNVTFKKAATFSGSSSYVTVKDSASVEVEEGGQINVYEDGALNVFGEVNVESPGKINVSGGGSVMVDNSNSSLDVKGGATATVTGNGTTLRVTGGATLDVQATGKVRVLGNRSMDDFGITNKYDGVGAASREAGAVRSELQAARAELLTAIDEKRTLTDGTNGFDNARIVTGLVTNFVKRWTSADATYRDFATQPRFEYGTWSTVWMIGPYGTEPFDVIEGASDEQATRLKIRNQNAYDIQLYINLMEVPVTSVGVIGKLAMIEDIPPVDFSTNNTELVETATAVVREHSGDYWDEELQVWWTGRMSGGKLTYMATTNVNLNAEH